LNRFPTFDCVAGLTQRFVNELVAMDEAKLKELFFTPDDVTLIRSLLG
jgi:hypothetical protein